MLKPRNNKIINPKIFVHKKINMFFMCYLMVVIILLVSLLPVYFYARNIVKRNIISESRYYMDNGVALLSTDINNIKNSNYYQLKNNLDVQKIKNIENLKTKDYFTLTKIHENLKEAIPTSDLVALSFIYFGKSNVIITSHQMYSTLHYIKDKHFVELLKGDNRSLTFEKKIELLGNQYNDVLLLYLNDSYFQSNANNLKIGALLAKDYIVDLLMSSKLKNNGWLYVEDMATGDVVLNYNYNGDKITSLSSIEDRTNEVLIDGQKNVVLSSYLPVINLRIVTGMENRFFNIETNDILQAIKIIFVLALIIGITISIILSHIANKPIRKLISRLQVSGVSYDDSTSNLDFINSALTNMLSESASLWDEVKVYKNQAVSGLVERLIHNSVINNDEIQTLNDYYKDVIEEFRVVLISVQGMPVSNSETLIENDGLQLVNVLVCENIDKYLKSTVKPLVTGALSFITVLKNTDDESLLASCNALEKRLLELLGLKTKAAISSVHNSIFELYIAIKECETTLVFSSDSNESVSVYNEERYAANNYIFDFTSAQRLYQLLIAGEEKNANLLIDGLFTKNRFVTNEKNEHLMQMYYTFRTIASSAYRELASDGKEPATVRNFTKNQIQRYMAGEIAEICRLSNENIEKKIDDKKTSIMNYIKENISSSILCASSVASYFSISEKYVAIIVKEKTGDSFAAYIEKLRMETAVELLENSDLKIQEVSERCGYGSQNSFYKAFKRNFDTSPSIYREEKVLANMRNY